ncbi:glycosyltransferase 8 domain-containing protein 1 isoform X2 [Monodelphis domestica]|uniref:glycosyltransferase 8 domain-containing protein 1 isoform X2 n=1 Tax=Monodelphis domestica TaxID=13616 RepID=UPI0024E1F0CD|nr:glycosyltransferase 8 domain-containing protein 1 isoform X2 [Monodelphis domestica]
MNIIILVLAVTLFLLVLHQNFLGLSDLLKREISDPNLVGFQPLAFVPNAPKSLLSRSEEEIPVVIAASEDRLGGTIAVMNSIYHHTHSNVVFYIVTLNDTADHLRKMKPREGLPQVTQGTKHQIWDWSPRTSALLPMLLILRIFSTWEPWHLLRTLDNRSWLSSDSLKSIQYKIVDFNPQCLEGKVKVDPKQGDFLKPLTFARFYLPNLVPNAKKAIYMDDDVIVQGDILALYNTPLKPGHAAAFSEDCDSTSAKVIVHGAGNQYNYIGFLDYKKKRIRNLAMKASTCSFNPGVFVANLTEWKQQNITYQLEKWMKLNVEEELYSRTLAGSITTPPLLIVFYKQHSNIDPMWNVRHLGSSAGKRYSPQFVKAAKLLHWNGHFKPWGRTAAYANIWEKWYIPDPTGKFSLIRRHGDVANAV